MGGCQLYELIALDLDGTLLNIYGRISPTSAAVLAAAQAAGMRVTLATARSWRSTRRFVEELGLNCPVICLAGAVTYSPAGQPVQAVPLAQDVAVQMAQLAHQHEWAVRVYFADGRVLQSRLAPDFAAGRHPDVDELVGDLRPYLEVERPVAAVVLGQQGCRSALAVADRWTGVRHDAYNLDTERAGVYFMSAAVSKGAALAALASYLGIPRERVIAMGDQEPDVSMITWAGAGVAMGWAPEPVQAAAGMVCPPLETEPIAWALRRLVPLLESEAI